MTHGEEPYLTYVSYRPHRVAFIVDIDQRDALDHIDKIISFAYRKWGGRFFQIIPSQNGKVSKDWLSYIKEYDPDVIQSFTDLDKATIQGIARVCHPYAFEKADPSRGISLHDDPIDIVPSKENIFRLTTPMGTPQFYAIALNQLRNDRTPKAYKRFVKFNFGQRDTTYFVERLLSGYEIKSEKVVSKRSLINAIDPLSEWNRYIYPSDFSRIPGVHYETNRESDNQDAILFVGDKPLDVIYFWNNALLSPEWLSRRMIHAWIPTSFLEDKNIAEPIKKWMMRFVDFGNGNSGYKKLILASNSVNKNTLRRYAKLLSDGTYIHVVIDKIKAPTIPKYSSHVAVFNDMKTYSVSGDRFNINLPPIEQMQGGMGGQKWMADFQIQRHDQDGRVTPPKELWLQLPRNNNLASCLFSKKPARVNRMHFPSIPLSRKSDFFRHENDLLVTIEIPEEARLVGNMLLREPDAIYYRNDLRTDLFKPPLGHYQSSQAGRLLRGFAHLFGGLMEAAHFFEASYWRRVVMTLAGEDPAGDTTVYRDLKNKVAKNLPKAGNPPTNKAINFWAKSVRTYAQQLRFDTTYKDFRFFKEELEEEIRQYKEKNGGKGDDYSEETEARLLQNLSWLIDNNVFHVGIMNNCKHCGLKAWYLIDNAKTLNECIGCGYEFSVRAEQKWWYKLNSLSGSNGAIYSQIPVIIALGQLHDLARYSFSYIPPIDIFARNSNKVLTDLDIFAIIDGSLVIGEVKNSQGLFEDDDFKKLKEAAKLIRPDKVIISSIDEKPNSVNEKRIKELQEKLQKYGIKVEWLELNPMIFESYPYYI